MRGSLAKEPFLAVGHLWPVDSMLFQRRFASKSLGCGATYPTTTQHLLFPPPPPLAWSSNKRSRLAQPPQDILSRRLAHVHLPRVSGFPMHIRRLRGQGCCTLLAAASGGQSKTGARDTRSSHSAALPRHMLVRNAAGSNGHRAP